MPEKLIATTRRPSRASEGAMKLNQSACAPLPCISNSPGSPMRPQARVSIAAPWTSTVLRSGASSTARSNQSGAGGLAPPKSASGARK